MVSGRTGYLPEPMADDYAITFRKNRIAAPRRSRDGMLPLGLLGMAAAVAGFALFSFLAPGQEAGRADVPRPAEAVAAAPRPAGIPRVISAVPGVRETGIADAAVVIPMGTRTLAHSYVASGPVVLRALKTFIEVDGPNLMPPPVGAARTERRVLDHAAGLATALGRLATTPCDLHLRYVAAANIILFVAGFHPQRTPIRFEAPANPGFWSRTEPSMIRRAVVEIAERGALAPGDFGLDRSPEIKGLFDGIRLGDPECR
jgi:hypothetical protein